MGLHGRVLKLVCLFVILIELLLEWSLFLTCCHMKPSSLLKLLGCNFMFAVSFTMWSAQLAALSRLQELLNFMSCFAPTISSTTAHFSDWPRLSRLPQLVLGSCTYCVHSSSFDNAMYESCDTLRGTFSLLRRWHNTVFRVKEYTEQGFTAYWPFGKSYRRGLLSCHTQGNGRLSTAETVQ